MQPIKMVSLSPKLEHARKINHSFSVASIIPSRIHLCLYRLKWTSCRGHRYRRISIDTMNQDLNNEYMQIALRPIAIPMYASHVTSLYIVLIDLGLTCIYVNCFDSPALGHVPFHGESLWVRDGLQHGVSEGVALRHCPA